MRRLAGPIGGMCRYLGLRRMVSFVDFPFLIKPMRDMIYGDFLQLVDIQ